LTVRRCGGGGSHDPAPALTTPAPAPCRRPGNNETEVMLGGVEPGARFDEGNLGQRQVTGENRRAACILQLSPRPEGIEQPVLRSLPPRFPSRRLAVRSPRCPRHRAPPCDRTRALRAARSFAATLR
jgi:hypothetical protein